MPRTTPKLTFITAALLSGVFLMGAGLTGCKSESAATLAADAKAYQQKGDLKSALIQLKNAVAKSPDDAAIRIALAELYNETGDSLSAEKEWRKAQSLGAPADKVLPGLVTALQGQGDYKKIIEETEGDAAKGSVPLLTGRGNAFLALGQLDNAKQAFDAVLQVKPGDGGALIGLASHAYSQKDVEGGNKFLAEALAKNASDADVWMYKGMVAGRFGQPGEAIKAYQQVLKLNPAHRTAHLEKAYLEIGMAQFDAAKADLDAARKLNPNSLVVTYTQALLDFTQGKNEVAMESVQKVLRAAPEHMPSVLLAGAIHLNLGQLEQAEQSLKKYLEKFPGTLYARKLLASAQLRASQPDQAAATLAPALKDGADDAQLLALAGESSMQARDFSKAAEYFGKASALSPETASLRTSLGLSKLGQGDKEQAVAEMEKAIALDPKSQQAGIALVRTALGLKQYDKAMAAVQALEKEQPANAIVQNMKGGVHLAKNDPAGARAAFAKAAQLQPSYFPAVANLAQLDLTERKYEDSRKRLEAFLQIDKKHIGALTALAELAVLQGDQALGTRWLEKASSENPTVAEPGQRLVAHYLKLGQKDKALTLARQLATSHAANPEVLDLLGQAQLANKDASGALDSWSKLAAAVPKSARAQMRLAQAHVALGNDSAAAEDIKRALTLDPENMQAQLATVDMAMRKGKVDESLAIARRLQKEKPNSPVAFLIEGDILYGQKKLEPAVAAYEKAYNLSKSPQMLVKLSQAQRLLGKGREADARLAQYMKDNPGEPLSSMYNAETQLAAKQYKQAIASFENVLKRNPANVVALNNLAWAYQQEKDPRALASAEQAYKLAPDNPAIQDTLGWILIERGDTKRGIAVLEQALSRAPDANDIRYHLAFGLHKAGDKARARKEIEQALANGKPFPMADDARALMKQL